MRKSAANIIAAVQVVLHEGPYRYLAAGLFLLGLVVYAFTLPAAYTGGAIGLVSLRYLTLPLAAFSLALAALVSLILTLNVHAFRASSRRRGAGVGAGGVLASLLPSAVCCTPVVPTLLAVLGASTPQIFGLTGRIQGVFAVYEPVFLAASLVLLLLALHLAARSVVGYCALAEWKDRGPRSGRERAPL